MELNRKTETMAKTECVQFQMCNICPAITNSPLYMSYCQLCRLSMCYYCWSNHDHNHQLLYMHPDDQMASGVYRIVPTGPPNSFQVVPVAAHSGQLQSTGQKRAPPGRAAQVNSYLRDVIPPVRYPVPVNRRKKHYNRDSARKDTFATDRLSYTSLEPGHKEFMTISTKLEHTEDLNFRNIQYIDGDLWCLSKQSVTVYSWGGEYRYCMNFLYRGSDAFVAFPTKSGKILVLDKLTGLILYNSEGKYLVVKRGKFSYMDCYENKVYVLQNNSDDVYIFKMTKKGNLCRPQILNLARCQECKNKPDIHDMIYVRNEKIYRWSNLVGLIYVYDMQGKLQQEFNPHSSGKIPFCDEYYLCDVNCNNTSVILDVSSSTLRTCDEEGRVEEVRVLPEVVSLPEKVCFNFHDKTFWLYYRDRETNAMEVGKIVFG